MSNKQNEFPEMIPTKDISLQEILNNLLDSTDLELKTEIANPKRLAILTTFSEYLQANYFPKTAKTIETFVELYLTYMVSHNRESRKEIIRALTTMIRESESVGLGKKLTTDLK